MQPRDPAVTARSDWPSVMGDVSVWTPSIARILHRHGLPAGSIRPTVPGSHATFYVGDRFVIKLFAPYWLDEHDDYAAEVRAAELLSIEPAFPTPTLLAKGIERGWPYVVTSRVAGDPLDEVRGQLSRPELLHLVRQLDEMMRALHQLAVDAEPGSRAAFVARQRSRWAPGGDLRAAVPDCFAADVCEFLESMALAHERPAHVALLHGDLGAEHVFVTLDGDAWTISGIIDFGDAFVADPIYDLVGPGLDIAQGDPELLHALFQAAGLDGAHELCSRLMTYTLLHRWIEPDDVRAWVDDHGWRTVHEAAQRLWPVG